MNFLLSCFIISSNKYNQNEKIKWILIMRCMIVSYQCVCIVFVMIVSNILQPNIYQTIKKTLLLPLRNKISISRFFIFFYQHRFLLFQNHFLHKKNLLKKMMIFERNFVKTTRHLWIILIHLWIILPFLID